MLSLILSLAAASCTPAAGDAAATLRRAAHVMGLDAIGSKVLHLQGYEVTSQDFQSDRWYPPFLSNVGPLDYWYAPAARVERSQSGFSMGGGQGQGPVLMSTEQAAFVVRDTTLVASDAAHSSTYVARPLNPWAVIADWIAHDHARVTARCMYRDYPRLVLTQLGVRRAERLFIDEKSGFPVKLERLEDHYLWGQETVEYVYSTWQRIGDAAIPGVSFRVVDGRTNLERNVGAMQLVALDSAPRLAVPASPRVVGFAPPAFLRASNPDTIRVGPHSFVLRNPGYAEMVSLARDTVFIFDATQGEERARHDSAWIAALFPGRHALALVVTDAAWPHVAGVRFWVAHGVPVYAPRAVRAFLDSVVERHWTLSPDLLERSRRPMRFVPVSDSLRVAGGDILLFALDGVASEAAIAAYDAPDHTLWASDYIQSAREPTQYLDEVCRATVRVNVTPDRVAAEHLPLTPWPALRPLAKCGP